VLVLAAACAAEPTAGPAAPACCDDESGAGSPGFFRRILDTSSYPPRWSCGTWTPGEGWLHICSDLGIWSAYLAIPLALAYFIRRRKDLPFTPIFWLFCSFIIACGTTHLMEVLMFWWPAYRLNGLVKLACALISWVTVVSLLPVIPRALSLRTAEELEREVRERTRAEEAERQMRDYTLVVESANAALATANQAAEAASQAKSEFLANMSHELRTPLTAILGFAEVLRDESGPAEGESRRQAVDTITRNGEHLLQLINDILDLSKIEAGRLEIDPRPCDPRKIVDDCVALMNVRAAAKGLALGVDCDPALPCRIQSDPTRIRQVLLNLLGNAIKFTEQGEVRLSAAFAAAPEPSIAFDVRDTGIGMTPQQAAAIFEPFRQAEASTARRFGGTGLGLTISRRLTEMLGGCLQLVESQPGAGSRFRAVIAAAAPADETDPAEGPGREPEPDDALPAGPRTLAGCRILFAEDGPDNQRLISHLLRKAGAEVALAADGAEAVDRALGAAAAGQPFDVILMDMQMPVMDGYEASRRLRAGGYTGPIIALTAHAMSGDREKCLAAGCTDYATKPIDRARLIAAIARRRAAATARA
jgi:signal transduction histidine kinase/ActR/RegA family two-component response regulator